ncbi:hypothetical protein AA11826_0230 [Komagataeibacter oboediens DSM 11826]|nr:hypothetical protein AA11826_0230 [Komagataeibacter oboediens DSM 11826]
MVTDMTLKRKFPGFTPWQWARLVLVACGYTWVQAYRPFGWLFGWQVFEARHGTWPEGLCFLCLLIALRMGWDRIILHRRWTDDLARTRHALERGEVRRMSFPVRLAFLLGSLAIVLLAVWMRQVDPVRNPGFLPLACGLFGLFALVEFSHVMFMGDGPFYDPHDEMQAFFRMRALRTGYGVMLLALALLLVVQVVAPPLALYAGPMLLAAGLIVPNAILVHLNRRAELTDESP